MMHFSIAALGTILQILHVHCWVIQRINAEAKLVIYPQQLYMNSFTGEPLDLICTGEATNIGVFSDFKWMNPRYEEIPKGSPGVEEVGRYSLLFSFINPVVEDSGVYKCLATFNKTEFLENEVSILFREDIKFENCSDHQVLYYNEEGEIMCIPVSNGELSVTWTKDSKKLKTGRFSLTPPGVAINNVKEEDAGTYEIEVFESATGTFKSKIINVEVINREEGNVTGAIERVSVLNVTKDTVMFEIQLSRKVKSIEAKYRESLDETDKIMTWKIGDSYILQNLIPSGRYLVRFRAKPWQSTEWSHTLNVTLLPEAPEVVLRQMDDAMLGIEWVRTVSDTKRNTIDKYHISYQQVHIFQGKWMKSSCNISTEIPISCTTSVYKLANLLPSTAYEIRVKAHTSSGFGEAYKQKFELFW